MIGESLRKDIDDYAARMRASSPLLDKARCGRVPPQAVGRYLASILYLIRHTPIHLQRAQRRALERGQKELAAYFEQKMREEVGHDQWAEADIAVLVDRFQVAVEPEPSGAMVGLVEYLDSAIDDEPTGYLAYILFAEYLTVVLGPEWIHALQSNCGVPAGAMTCVGRHVELDRHHVRDGLREIDALARGPRDHQAMRRTLTRSMEYFHSFCEEISHSIH